MKERKIVAFCIVLIACLLTLTACGPKYIAGVYDGNWSATGHEKTVAGMCGGPDTVYDKWGVDVKVRIDKDGKILEVSVFQLEGYTYTTNTMGWPIFGGRFYGQFAGNWTVEEVLAIKLDVGSDGFPVLNGDGSSFHAPEGKSLVVVNDYEDTCAFVLLALQQALTTNAISA